jgi:DNA-binding transcriptional MerR regulator
MFRIGDFAKLAQVTPKTLRLYDRLGLLKPAIVAPTTDYRYYTLDQLPRLNRILALKALGFSLEQIARMLNRSLPASELRGMLHLKQAELEQHARETLEQLARVEARLKQIELEDMMPDYEVVLKKIQSHADDPDCLICRDLKEVAGLINKDEDVLRHAAQEPLPGRTGGPRWIKKIDGPPHGEPLPPDGQSMFFMRTAKPPGPDAAPPSMPGPDTLIITIPFVEAHTLPGVEVAATTLHEGSRETMVLAFRALTDWISANGYQVAGHYQEVQLREGELYELAIPVLKTT